jgi:hypothetical protein
MQLNNTLNRFAWIATFAAPLTLSSWSLFWVGRKYGLPVPFAAIIGVSFDGAAIACAELELKYAKTHGDSGFTPKIMVWILASLSAYLNMQHAILNNSPQAARVLFAAPPIIGVILFQLHVRWERRGALRRAGRVAQSLPAFGRVTWVLFPIRTMGTVRKVARHRLAAIEHREITGIAPSPIPIEPGKRPPSIAGPTAAVRVVDTAGNEIPAKDIRYWARLNGIEIGARGRIHESILRAYVTDIAGAHLEEIGSGVNGYSFNGQGGDQ